MKAIVNPDTCTGCGLCVDICPEVFEMDGDLAVVKVKPVPEDSEEAVDEAVDSCPVEAISVQE